MDFIHLTGRMHQDVSPTRTGFNRVFVYPRRWCTNIDVFSITIVRMPEDPTIQTPGIVTMASSHIYGEAVILKDDVVYF
jgi:hypothetical protein